MQQYSVGGMSCASCSRRIEQAVSAVPGVTSCSVSLLTNSMGVEGTASPRDIVRAVKQAGYTAHFSNAPSNTSINDDVLTDTETPALKKRLLVSLVFLVCLLYLSMGHRMWHWPTPHVFDNDVFLGLSELLLALIVMGVNHKFFIHGLSAAFHRAPNMDTLVALGSGTAFVYSVFILFLAILAMGEGDGETVMRLAMNFYFESAAMIPTLITVGKLLESLSKGRTTNALKSLMRLSPKTAVVLRDGKEEEISVDEVAPGDIFVVRPGQSIPVDGVIIDGTTAINEATLTGESLPLDKTTDDIVSAGTLNLSGYITCRAKRVGKDTTLAQIIKTVTDAAATKAPISRVADKVSGIFVPTVIALSLSTCFLWLALGRDVGFSIARAMSVLVISCPCALGLATPVAIMVGSGMGAKSGILYKTAASLEALGHVNTVVLDKTGTITRGEPEVTDIIPFGAFTERALLSLAAALEAKSEHPLAKAVMKKASSYSISPADVSNFQIFAGNGLTAVADGQAITGGSFRYIAARSKAANVAEDTVKTLASEGKTPLLFMQGEEFAGIIAVADTIKKDAPGAIMELHALGLRVIMLTGDNEGTAKAIGQKAGVDEVIANVLPEGKATVIRQLKTAGRVAMVGDGINDAPALTSADVGIAIGAGTDVAIDSADIVLMKSLVSDIPAAIRMSRLTIRNIHENLFWAFIYNVLCIPLAMGLYGLAMKPMYGAAAMSLSSVCVCLNALRLNTFNPHDTRRDAHLKTKPAIRKKPKNTKEVMSLIKTLTVEGMMCQHCEARVQKALQDIDGVESAVADHAAGTAVVTLSKPVSDDILKKAVEQQDYHVNAIE